MVVACCKKISLRYSLHAISTLLWPGYSPDLNMIEPAWPHLNALQPRKELQRIEQSLQPPGRMPGQSLSNGEFRRGLNEFQGILKRSLGLREEMDTKRVKRRKSADSRAYRLSGRTWNSYNMNLIDLPNCDIGDAKNATVHGPSKDF
jgi:hypothetical protein